uniref:NPH3 domain-containing protein n=1 Tax=Macrostomum lignano TaxID=282301 RepID=A0A1I8FQ69_9PLAT
AIRAALGHGQQQQQQQRHAAAAARNRNPSAPFVVPHPPAWPPRTAARRFRLPAANANAQGPGPQFEAVAEGFKENTMEPRPWNERGGLQESPGTLQVHEDDIPQLSSVGSGVPWRRPPASAAYKRRACPKCAPKKAAPDRTTPRRQIVRRLRSAAASAAATAAADDAHQLKPGERFMCQIDKLYMGLQEVCFEELARRFCVTPNAAAGPSVAQPPPPPRCSNRILRTIRAIAPDFSKDQSRETIRGTRPPWSSSSSDAHARNPPPSARRLAASNDALVRCREQLEQRIAELETAWLWQTEEASRELGQGSPDPSGGRPNESRTIWKQRDAEIEELRRQVQQQQQQINEHRQQQQQQQQQASTASGLANADARRQAAAQLIGGSIAY